MPRHRLAVLYSDFHLFHIVFRCVSPSEDRLIPRISIRETGPRNFSNSQYFCSSIAGPSRRNSVSFLFPYRCAISFFFGPHIVFGEFLSYFVFISSGCPAHVPDNRRSNDDRVGRLRFSIQTVSFRFEAVGKPAIVRFRRF